MHTLVHMFARGCVYICSRLFGGFFSLYIFHSRSSEEEGQMDSVLGGLMMNVYIS